MGRLALIVEWDRGDAGRIGRDLHAAFSSHVDLGEESRGGCGLGRPSGLAIPGDVGRIRSCELLAGQRFPIRRWGGTRKQGAVQRECTRQYQTNQRDGLSDEGPSFSSVFRLFFVLLVKTSGQVDGHVTLNRRIQQTHLEKQSPQRRLNQSQ